MQSTGIFTDSFDAQSRIIQLCNSQVKPESRQFRNQLIQMFPDYPLTQSLKFLIDESCAEIKRSVTIMQEKLEKYVFTQIMSYAKKFTVLEQITQIINNENEELSDVDGLIQSLSNPSMMQRIQEQLFSYSNAQKQIELYFIRYLDYFQQDPPPIEQISFERVPDVYNQYTYTEIVGNSAKHLEGYPCFITTNQLVQQGSSIIFKMSSIQQDYVGVGVGLMERYVLETAGQVIPMDALQNPNHGLYLNFNDRCKYLFQEGVYHSKNSFVNGPIKGKNQGIQFQTGDIIKLLYLDGTLLIQNLTSDQSIHIKVDFQEMLFVVWLDMSQVEII